MGRNRHHRYHKAADAAVQKAQVSLLSSTAVDGGTQQLQWRRRKSTWPITHVWRRLICLWCCASCWPGISPIKQEWEGWTRSLLTLPFQFQVKLCSTTSQSSMAIWLLPQRPLEKTASHAMPASSSAWSAFHYLGASCCQHMLKLCSACQKTGLIYLTFQQIREKII